MTKRKLIHRVPGKADHDEDVYIRCARCGRFYFRRTPSIPERVCMKIVGSVTGRPICGGELVVLHPEDQGMLKTSCKLVGIGPTETYLQTCGWDPETRRLLPPVDPPKD